MFCSVIVLPAFGGETIRPRWPLPIGETMSIRRPMMRFGVVSIRRRSSGYNGVSLLKFGRSCASSTLRPLMSVIDCNGMNF